MFGQNLQKTGVSGLTKSQLAIWTGQQLNSCVPLYNMAFTFDFKGEINVEHFQNAFQILINKSDTMRTIFRTENGNPQREVLNEVHYEIEVLDWSDKTVKEFQQWTDERIKKNFDLSKCLFDSVLIKLSDERYIWYINQHHLITDGWSISGQYKAFADIYRLLIEGKSTENYQVPQFQDYVEFEKNNRQKLKDSSIEKYWKEKWESLPNPPKLYGYDAEKNETSSTRTSLEIGVERSKKLLKIAQTKDFRLLSPQLTIFNIFATLLYAYIYRISNEKKIVIGTPSHNRFTKSFKDTPGVFIEFFPLLSEVLENDTFLTLFNRLKVEANSYLRNAQAGASVESQGKNFNVILNYFTNGFSNFNGIKCEVDWLHSGYFDSHNHLSLVVYDFTEEGNFRLSFDINNSAIPKAKQETTIGHFLKLLDAFLENYEHSIDEIDILSSDERRQILEFGNAIREIPEENRTILNVFKQTVEKSADKIAVGFQNKSITFKELDERSNQFANRLIKLGIKKEERVGIFLGRSTDLLVSVYGILKAGGAYVPLDAMFPQERLKFIIENADISTLISHEKLTEKLPDNNCKIISLDSDTDSLETESKTQPDVEIDASDLAYVIYTSGSTGKPKGSMNEHGCVIRLIEKLNKHVYSLYEGHLNFCLIAPSVFDASVLKIFATSLLGYTLQIAPESARFDGKELGKFYSEFKIDISDGTPSHLRFLAQTKEDFQLPKHFIVGGEALSAELIRDFQNRFKTSPFTVSNIYGVAECCVDSTGYDVSNADEIKYPFVPIGKPLLGDRIYILNEANQLQPIGTSGEICIGGGSVGRGYLKLEELTKNKFVENPFISNERVYKTGDLGFFLPDGNIQYKGRKDSQVNVNGYRIELGEIEARILSFKTKIKNVLVVVREDDEENDFLCAYFVADQKIKVNELRRELTKFLPSYMVPTHFVQLEKFPLTTNGKVDKRSLPTPDKNSLELESEFVAPSTEIEEVIVEIWSEVLEIEKVGIYDNFLELGGNSLATIRIMTRVNDKLELDLPLNKIFETPTIASLSEYVEQTILSLLEEDSAYS